MNFHFFSRHCACLPAFEPNVSNSGYTFVPDWRGSPKPLIQCNQSCVKWTIGHALPNACEYWNLFFRFGGHAFCNKVTKLSLSSVTKLRVCSVHQQPINSGHHRWCKSVWTSWNMSGSKQISFNFLSLLHCFLLALLSAFGHVFIYEYFGKFSGSHKNKYMYIYIHNVHKG